METGGLHGRARQSGEKARAVERKVHKREKMKAHVVERPVRGEKNASVCKKKKCMCRGKKIVCVGKRSACEERWVKRKFKCVRR